MGVSCDRPEISRRFRASLNLPYPLVADPAGTVARAYRARWPLLGLARRVTYLIDHEGRVKLAFRSEFDADAHVERIKAALAEPAPRRPPR